MEFKQCMECGDMAGCTGCMGRSSVVVVVMEFMELNAISVALEHRLAVAIAFEFDIGIAGTRVVPRQPHQLHIVAQGSS